MEIKISVNFFFLSRIGALRVKHYNFVFGKERVFFVTEFSRAFSKVPKVVIPGTKVLAKNLRFLSNIKRS